MRFLFVNNYKPQTKQLGYFNDFIRIVKETVDKSPNINDINNDYIIIQDHKEIERYLVDGNLLSGDTKSQQFDLIDVVYIIGDQSRLPWAPGNRRVNDSLTVSGFESDTKLHSGKQTSFHYFGCNNQPGFSMCSKHRWSTFFSQ